MIDDDLARSFLDRVLDACTLYERRQLSEVALRVAIERNAGALRILEPDTARVLDSFAHVVDTVARTTAPEARWLEICGVADRIRDFVQMRDRPAEPTPASPGRLEDEAESVVKTL